MTGHPAGCRCLVHELEQTAPADLAELDPIVELDGWTVTGYRAHDTTARFDLEHRDGRRHQCVTWQQACGLLTPEHGPPNALGRVIAALHAASD